MAVYADSSFLVSCYVLDANTRAARLYLSQSPEPLIFTRLHDLEVRNAFELALFRKLVSAADVTAARTNLDRDLQAGRLVQPRVRWADTFRFARQISDLHCAQLGVRSLDVLHVAAASRLRPVRFVSFDIRQRALAQAIGMTTAP